MSKPGKQTSKASKPRLTIESQDETKAGAPASQAANGSESVDDEIDFHEAAGFIRGLGMLMWRYARSHPHTVLYGFIGFVLAALILILGYGTRSSSRFSCLWEPRWGKFATAITRSSTFLASYLTGTKAKAGVSHGGD